MYSNAQVQNSPYQVVHLSTQDQMIDINSNPVITVPDQQPKAMELNTIPQPIQVTNVVQNHVEQTNTNAPPVGSEEISETEITTRAVYSESERKSLRKKTFIIFFCFQCLSIILFGCCSDLGDGVHPNSLEPSTISTYYPMFQDVHVMIFIGFGFLMTFTKYHSWTSVGFNYCVAAWAIQWGMLCKYFFDCCVHNEFEKLHVSVEWLIEGDFAAGAVLISFGAVLGKVNMLQLFMMAVFECIFYAANAAMCQYKFYSVDMGGSM